MTLIPSSYYAVSVRFKETRFVKKEYKMKKNMGSIDKTIRLILGIVVIALGIIFQSWWGLIGLLLVGTSSLSFCPLYVPFRFSTRKDTAESKKA